jgi:hypothetical protein
MSDLKRMNSTIVKECGQNRKILPELDQANDILQHDGF